TAFHLTFQTMNPDNWPQWQSFVSVWFTMFQLFLGLLDIPINYELNTPEIIKILYVFYMIFAFLLMINLLIASMGDTHWRVAQERDELWRTQVAASTILLERRMPRALWPRIGWFGGGYDLDKRWFLSSVSRQVPRLLRSAKSFSHKCHGEERTRRAKAKLPWTFTGPRQTRESGSVAELTGRSSGRGWQILRETVFRNRRSNSQTSQDQAPEVVYQ
uniref:Uncharacterized protein n=1 Tax=Petromyzon marinus TaxID=7757 RepID=S4RUJ4_PETMA